MTTAQHPPNLSNSIPGISGEPSHPFSDSPTHSTTTAPPDSLQSTVSSIVDSIVDNAVATSSLNTEKRNVQAIINKLVSQVHDEALAAQKSTLPSPPNSTTSERQRLFGGVHIGDHRLRKCPNLPVTWTQTIDSLTLNVDVPHWVRKNQILVQFSPGAIKAAVMHQSDAEPLVLFDEPLVAQISVDGCMWALEEEGNAKKLFIEVEKARMQWWARLFMSDDPKDYVIVKPSATPHQTDGSNTASTRTHSASQMGQAVMPGSRESMSTHTTESGLQPEQPSDHTLEDGVAAFVDEVIDNAASAKTNKSCHATGANSGSRGKTETPAPRQQRVLTRADIPKMVERCKQVIARGGPAAYESALQLATFYHHGLGVEQNDAEAARLYKYALENGILDPSAAFQLGLIYNQGAPGVEPDATEAVRWWRVSASLRNPVAMFNLGVMYMNGTGCEMDPIMATRWFQQAQSLDPRLQPPQFSRAQLEERIAAAMKLRKQRLKRALPPEEKQRRKELALQKVRTMAYGTMAVAGIGMSVVALRYWWRNRL